MLRLNNVQFVNGARQSLSFEADVDYSLDAENLVLFPGLIDPHVHFRVPGQEYKEDWVHAAKATIMGGYTMVFDMPNNIPPCITLERLQAKKALIDSQLQAAGIPLRYELYFGADKNSFDEVERVKGQVVGIKVFMGSSTGELLMDDDDSLHAIYQLASQHDMLIALHAEDEELIQERQKKFAGELAHCVHSKVRNPEVAKRAVEKVVFLSEKYNVRSYVLHVSTIEELAVIRAAKAKGIKIYAETTPHHLFLNTSDYDVLGGRAQMNPPLRDRINQEALFAAIGDGTIDTIGSDHAPHTMNEKDQVYGKTPSGVPGIETTLPLLLNAYHAGKISLESITNITSKNIQSMFNLPAVDDFVLVDLTMKKKVQNGELKTKCGWSPFEGRELQGWPTHVYMNKQFYILGEL